MDENFFTNVISNFINGFNDVVGKVFEAILIFLPTSPFVDIKSKLDPYFLNLLGYVNYYIPLGTILTIVVSWLGCIAIYYGYQTILRLIKAID